MLVFSLSVPARFHTGHHDILHFNIFAFVYLGYFLIIVIKLFIKTVFLSLFLFGTIVHTARRQSMLSICDVTLVKERRKREGRKTGTVHLGQRGNSLS